MKKLILPAILAWGSLSYAQEEITALNPMDNYTPSTHSDQEIASFWNSMTTELKDKDCYKRAHIWSYWLYRTYNVHSTKIFIHYTQRFNDELDELGDASNISSRLRDNVDERTRRMARKNTTWDYHVAPMVTTHDGRKVVLEKSLVLAHNVPTLEEARALSDMERYDERSRRVLSPEEYVEEARWNLQKRPASPEEWLEGLTVRGEILWDARKVLLEQDMAELQHEINSKRAEIADYENRIRATDSDRRIRRHRRSIERIQEDIDELQAELNPIQNKYRSLGMADNDKIDIKCKKVDSIADVDKNHETEWCYVTEAPMYYWNEIDLRYLAYGNVAYQQSGWRYIGPIPPEYHTQEAYLDGRNYVQNYWDPEELEISAGEFKSNSLRTYWRDLIDEDFDL